MNPRRPGGALTLPPLRRRGFLALGGASLAAGALVACGEELPEPSAERDVALLSAALVGEENTAGVLGAAGDDPDAKLVAALARQASDAANRLQEAISKLDAAPAEGEFEAGGASGDAALRAAVAHTNAAIVAYRDGAGQLSETALRREALELISSAGARLAILHGLLGEQEAPHPFVTGEEGPPFASTDPDDGEADAGGEETTTERDRGGEEGP